MSPDFHTPDIEKNKGRRALILIQGSGAVRAGMWARSPCINDGFEKGTMMKCMDVALKNSIPTLVMNPNQNWVNGTPIPFSKTNLVHATYVWEQYVKNSGFTRVQIIVHSAGGICVRAIMKEFADTFWKQVSHIAYTDSWVIEKSMLNEEQ